MNGCGSAGMSRAAWWSRNDRGAMKPGRRGGRLAVLAVPWVWLLLFFLIPFVIVLKISFAETALSQPPYTDMLDWSHGQYPLVRLHTANYLGLLADAIYVQAFISSLKVAAI